MARYQRVPRIGCKRALRVASLIRMPGRRVTLSTVQASESNVTGVSGMATKKRAKKSAKSKGAKKSRKKK